MIRIRASRRQPARDLHLLLVAAGQRADLGVDRCRLDLQGSRLIQSPPPAERDVQQRHGARSGAGWRCRCCRRSTARRSGSRGDPAPSARGRAPPHASGPAIATRSPSTRISPVAAAGLGAVDRQRRLDAAGAEQAEQADHLALGARRGRARSPAAAPRARKQSSPRICKATGGLRRRTPRRASVLSRSPIISATISGRETAAAWCRPRIRPSRMTTMRSAIAKTSARRCDTKMMATPRALSARMRSNSRADSVLGQRRGRLVEDEQPGLLGERPGDDDQLLGGKIERRHRGAADRSSSPNSRQRSPGDARAAGDVDHAPARRLGVEGDVLGDGQVGDDIDLLRHQRDACGLGLGDAARRDRACPDRRSRPIAAGRMDAGEDLDQRRLCPRRSGRAARRSRPGRCRSRRRRPPRTPGNSLVRPRGRRAAAREATDRAAGRRPLRSAHPACLGPDVPAYWHAGFLSGTFL